MHPTAWIGSEGCVRPGQLAPGGGPSAGSRRARVPEARASADEVAMGVCSNRGRGGTGKTLHTRGPELRKSTRAQRRQRSIHPCSGHKAAPGPTALVLKGTRCAPACQQRALSETQTPASPTSCTTTRITHRSTNRTIRHVSDRDQMGVRTSVR